MAASDEFINKGVPEEEYKEILADTLHTLRNINGNILASAESLSQTVRGNKVDTLNLKFHVDTIFHESAMLTTWLDQVTYRINPYFFSAEDPRPVSLYKQFHKATIYYRKKTKEKKMTIKLETEKHNEYMIYAHPSITVLPQCIFDNVIKYSPTSANATVKFSETMQKVFVEISSIGPFVEPAEIDRLFDRRFRGKHAQDADKTGLGLGLTMVKYICDLNGASIQPTSSRATTQINGIPYSEFVLSLSFEKPSTRPLS